MECEEVKKENPDVNFESCCDSCHEDDSTGHGQDLWFDIDGRERNVCCAVNRSIERSR